MLGILNLSAGILFNDCLGGSRSIHLSYRPIELNIGFTGTYLTAVILPFRAVLCHFEAGVGTKLGTVEPP